MCDEVCRLLSLCLLRSLRIGFSVTPGQGSPRPDVRPALFTMPFFGRSMWERGLLSAGPPASWDPWNEGPRPERHLLVKRAIMHGFLTTDFAPRYEEAVAALAGWVREGKLK